MKPWARLTVPLLLGAVAAAFCPAPSAQRARRGGTAARQPVPVRFPDPDTGVDSLAARAKAQRETVDQFKVVYDFQFTDRVKESGITFVHHIVDDAGLYYKPVHYDHGNGIAVADVDGDGLLDIYFVNQLGASELWKNLGGGKFRNITKEAGVGLADRIGVTASFADIDNDGDQDLFVTTVREGNVLFENDGHGHFKDISKSAGVDYVGHSSGAVFVDYDNDGLLDMYLCNVGRYHTPWFVIDCAKPEMAVAEGCKGRTDRILVMAPLGTRSAVIFDVDGDGDLDIVTNEFNSQPHVLISNLAERRPIHWLSVALVGATSNRNGLGAANPDISRRASCRCISGWATRPRSTASRSTGRQDVSRW